ncbi:MAG: hypothetical protein KIG95_02200 [Comamonas sp.]|nr:hypothetical protein [Comamonas sp.]
MKLHIVPPSAGLQWIRLGLQTFGRQPWALSVLFFLSMAAVSVASMLPLIGPVLALALLPTASLVMMVAAAEAWQHRTPTPALLLMAFRTGRQRLRILVHLGVLYAIGFGLLMLLSSTMDGGEFARVYLGLQPLNAELAQTPSFQRAMWLAMLLYLPLSLLFWHAPALAHWHQVSALKAMFFSIVACTRNMGAFLVYGLGWLVLMGVFGVGLGLVLTLLMLAVGPAAGILVVAGAMALAAVFFTSTVFSFRDCFSAPEAQELPQELP